jgi:leader peptidase (prepilin peptidase)/N-methyltransferase
VVKPASRCPNCKSAIPGRHNIPIVGYLLLRGKTACCGTPLSPRYPIVETISAVLCVALVKRYVLAADPNTFLLWALLIAFVYFAFAGALLIATFVDLEYMEIPDEVSLPGAALGLATAFFRDPPGAASAALGAGLGFLLVQVLFVWGYEILLGRRGMGEGDSKLLLMIGAFLGWQGAAFAIFAGAAQGLVVAAFLLLTGKSLTPERPADEHEHEHEDEHEGEHEHEGEQEDEEPPPSWVGHLKLPFGPFLALGAYEYLFFGDTLVALWLALATRITGG